MSSAELVEVADFFVRFADEERNVQEARFNEDRDAFDRALARLHEMMSSGFRPLGRDDLQLFPPEAGMARHWLDTQHLRRRVLRVERAKSKVGEVFAVYTSSTMRALDSDRPSPNASERFIVRRGKDGSLRVFARERSKGAGGVTRIPTTWRAQFAGEKMSPGKPGKDFIDLD